MANMLCSDGLADISLATFAVKCSRQQREHRPAVRGLFSGVKTASSSFRWRRSSSSSYSLIVLSKCPNISSTAAVSRWLTNSFRLCSLDILLTVVDEGVTLTSLRRNAWSATTSGSHVKIKVQVKTGPYSNDVRMLKKQSPDSLHI